jgi:hypothetical protein
MPQPEPSENSSRTFSEERALEHVRMLASFGPKVVGSRANEELALNYLLGAVNQVW